MSSVPRHQQVSDWLREEITSGRRETDEQLPSEKELCERFGISRITVRRALQTLEAEGLIYRRQGLGSFVQEPHVRQPLVRLTDFAQDMERAGLRPASHVLHRAPEDASPLVAEALDLEPGQQVLRLDRLRLGDEQPVAFDRTWLPLFYAQLLEGHDLEQETIYRILERHYGIPVLGGRYRIDAVNAPASVASHLDVDPDCALLLVSRISYTAGRKRIYYQQRFYRSDRITYELELARDEDRGREEGGMPLREFEPVFHIGTSAPS